MATASAMSLAPHFDRNRSRVDIVYRGHFFLEIVASGADPTVAGNEKARRAAVVSRMESPPVASVEH